MDTSFPRSLSEEERRVMDKVLSVPFAGVVELREQVNAAQVTRRCGCGCPTIDFEVDAAAPSLVGLPRRLMLVEAAITPEDEPTSAHILLFVLNGRLQCLEYVGVGDVPPHSWPPESWIEPLAGGIHPA